MNMSILTKFFLSMALSSEDPLEGIDIEEEYKLIMKKKSKLSANLRNRVVYRYNKNQKKHEKKTKNL